MLIRDRIKDFRRVSATALQPHPKNWRVHNTRQRNVLQGILAEVGYADALLVRELPDGSLQLIDGHLRAETTPNQKVPVLVLDLNDAETDKLLATFDPLSALADTDQTMLDDLLAHIETENIAVQEFLRGLSSGVEGNTDFGTNGDDHKIPEVYQILITCQDENEQREVFERLTAEGRQCRMINL
ncbi:MAG: hypothetical protein LBI05_06850 [Planctomycetaceae bacterium]|jgi:hypothetical protein|nr:hypothetical protein [Planctomycetaceae bacterium]